MKNEKLGGIEAMRGIAAVSVVAYHAARHVDINYNSEILHEIFQFGHSGVDLFFVLSGFIIYFVHFNDIGNPNQFWNYLERRFTRVFPVYWVALLLTLGLSLAGGHDNLSFWNVILSLSLFPSHSEPLLGVAWTLQYEIVFYAMFCVLILNKAAGVTVFSVWFCGILLESIGFHVFTILPRSIFGIYNFEFFFGMAAACIVRKIGMPKPKLAITLGCLLFTIAAVAEDSKLLNGYDILARFAYGLPSILLVGGAAELGRQVNLKIPRILRILGAASYSIYLFQFIFIGLLWKGWLSIGFRDQPAVMCFFLLFFGGVIGGVMISHAVEYPILKFVRAEFRKPQLASTQL